MTGRRQTLADLLHRTARRDPGKLAIACGGVEWTYAEFDALCSRLAAGLHASGIGKGAHVAVLSRNSHAFAALRFALARLGAVLVPINFMLKAEEVAYILRHAGVRALAVDEGLAELGRAAAKLDTQATQFIGLPGETSPEPQGSAVLGFAALAATSAAPPAVDLSGGDLAQIVYTSGTESLPKGAMLSHEAVVWQYVSCIVDGEMTGDDLMLHALPLYHCAQLDVFLGPAVCLGCTSVITGVPSADNLLPLLERHRISSFFAPPTVWISLLRSPLLDRTDLSALRKGYYGASSYISVVDRKKDMIKTGGENVASREVEEAIYGLPQVSEVAVIGLPHPRWVEAVTAAIVVKAGQTLTEGEVTDFCDRRLGGFKVPKGIVFVEALPKNPSGKLLKRELRKQFERHFAA